MRALVCALVLSCLAPTARADDDYAAATRQVAARRAALAARWREAEDRSALVGPVAREITRSARRLSRHWLGTSWGLGPPQSAIPGQGKINCGTFVGTILRDAGFLVDVQKLQRQPSQLIIRSFVGPARMKKWSNAPMQRFLADVRAMGPGLYIIGLDFHVGFLVQTERDLRFVHASYETRTVVDEAAASAGPITASKYRVVGKLLDRGNVRDWLVGRRIQVIGKW